MQNWFQAKNGPSGESLVRLCRHSDHVFEALLVLAGRRRLLEVKRFGDLSRVLRQMLTMAGELEQGGEVSE